MPKFIVEVREVHIQAIKVSARNEKEAIEKVRNGGGEQLNMEYSHTLDSDTWTARKSD